MLSEQSEYYVYLLIDPRSGRVFYVGKGSLRYGLSGRLRDHIAKARAGARGTRYNTIREILAAGLRPEQETPLQGVTEAKAYSEERRLVRRYGLHELTNAKDGGGGGPTDVQTGENHWMARHPELVLRGDAHPIRRDPSRAARGERHGRHTKPEATARGARHGCAKLTEQQVDEIRRLYVDSRRPGQAPITAKVLAEQFGVSGAQIGRILKGGWGKPNLLPHHGNRKPLVVEPTT